MPSTRDFINRLNQTARSIETGGLSKEKTDLLLTSLRIDINPEDNLQTLKDKLNTFGSAVTNEVAKQHLLSVGVSEEAALARVMERRSQMNTHERRIEEIHGKSIISGLTVLAEEQCSEINSRSVGAFTAMIHSNKSPAQKMINALDAVLQERGAPAIAIAREIT